MKGFRPTAASVVACCLVVLISDRVAAQETIRIRGYVAGDVTFVPLSLAELRFRINYHAAGFVEGFGPVATGFISPDVQIQPLQRKIIAATPSWNVDLDFANGDQLNGRYTFPSSVIRYSWLGFFSIPVDVEVYDGSGVFNSATGTARAQAFGNVYLRKFVILFDGTGSTSGQ